jgi:hypothetical protein
MEVGASQKHTIFQSKSEDGFYEDCRNNLNLRAMKWKKPQRRSKMGILMVPILLYGNYLT